MAVRAQLVLPAIRVPGETRALLRRAPRLGPTGVPQERDAGLHPRWPGGLLGQPREGVMGDPVPAPRGWLVVPASGRVVGSGARPAPRLVRRPALAQHRRAPPRRP